MIPLGRVQRDDADARLDQSSSHQERLAVPVVHVLLRRLMRIFPRLVAVASQRFRRLVTEIERLANFRRRDHFQRLSLKAIQSAERLRPIQLALQVIERGEQRLAVFQHFQVLDRARGL